MVLANPHLDIPTTTKQAPAATAAGRSRSDEGTTDHELVEELKRGESRALEVLVSRHQQRVLRLVLSILKNPMEAEEAVQDVFFTVFYKIHTFRGDSSFSTWIHRIAVNAALLRKRRDKSAANVSLDESGDRLEERTPWLDKATEWASPPRDRVLEDEASEVIDAAVARLDSKYSTVFRLRDVEGFSIESTARMLELGVPAVKTRLHRARLHLRRELSDYFGRKA